MLYLNHILLTSEKIIDYIHKNLDTLKTPKDELSPIPSTLKQFQKKLQATFFLKQETIEIIYSKLDDPISAFATYPKLKSILKILLKLERPEELDEAIVQIEALDVVDWEFVPERFDDYNHQYGYFLEPSDELRTFFQELCLACRTQIVLFEQNNTFDDTMAYEYAYKLMALYIDPSIPLEPQSIFRNIYQLMKSVDHNKSRPLHEALLVKLNPLPPASIISDMKGWREFIIKTQVKGLTFFVAADKIEREMQKDGSTRLAPKNIKQANELLMRSQYSRFEEDIAFAALCHKYKVSETSFNICLDYIQEGWPKKEKDDIPSLVIAGQKKAEGFFWLKLPPTDKRGLILGEITDCCQSLGGHSEQCVKDAMTLASNGLYVLVKQKKKKDQHYPLIVHGQINEENYKIVGQSYVWKSSNGNLCLDSLECLGGDEISLEIQQSILSDFATEILEKFPSIHYITLGQGGKTPEGIFEKASLAEEMLEGIPYPDSSLQYCIAKRPLALNPKYLTLLESFDQASEYTRNYVFRYAKDEFLDVLQIFFVDDVNAENHLSTLKKLPNQNDLLFVLIYLIEQRLFDERVFEKFDYYPNPFIFLNVIPILLTIPLFQGALAMENWIAILEMTSILLALTNALKNLNRTGLFNEETAQENFFAILQHHQPVELSTTLLHLHTIHLLTDENFKAMLHYPYPLRIKLILQKLENTSLLIRDLAQDNFDAIIKHQNPESLNLALGTINKVFLLEKEDSQLIFQMILTHAHPSDLAYAMKELYACDFGIDGYAEYYRDHLAAHEKPLHLIAAIKLLHEKKLLNLENCASICAHPQPLTIGNAIKFLDEADLLTPENRASICAHPEPIVIAYAIKFLDEADLLTPENRASICAHPEPIAIAKAIKFLDEADLLTSENRASICAHPEPIAIAKAIKFLDEADLLTPENRASICAHDLPEVIANTIKCLHEADLLTPENRASICAHPEPIAIAKAIKFLHEAGILLPEYLNSLSTHSNILDLEVTLSVFSNDLNQENFKALLHHPDLSSLSATIKKIQDFDPSIEDWIKEDFQALSEHPKIALVHNNINFLISQGLVTKYSVKKILMALVSHPYLDEFHQNLIYLFSNKLLNESSLNALITHPASIENYIIFSTHTYHYELFNSHLAMENLMDILKHPSPKSMATALALLDKSELLSDETGAENRKILAQHPDPLAIALALRFLHLAKLSTPENRQAIAAHQEPKSIGLIIMKLESTGLFAGDLAQTNFEAVLIHPHPARLFSEIKSIDSDSLDQTEFDKLTKPLASMAASRFSLFDSEDEKSLGRKSVKPSP
jgi:hypothetical protein